MIYLDYSANTPVDPAVLDIYCKTELAYIANPNSTHCAGQAARAEMARVTESIASQLGVQPAEIIYTSGASEANNLALKGIAQASRHIGKHIISTQLEHSSVGASLSVLQQQGYEIDLLNVNRDGKADLAQLRELLRKDTILVASVPWTARSAPCSLSKRLPRSSSSTRIAACMWMPPRLWVKRTSGLTAWTP